MHHLSDLRQSKMLLLILPIFLTISTVASAVIGRGANPFTPKSYAMRYWNKKISKDLPTPSFLIDKASPLTAADYAVFSKLAGNQTSLSAHLHDFCAKANLFCLLDLFSSLKKHVKNDNFENYDDKDFTNYGSNRFGSANSFHTYSDHFGVDANGFRRYSRDSIGHDDTFATYAERKNMPKQSFNGYGTKAKGGKGHFSSYNVEVNVPNLQFTTYSDNTEGRTQTFNEYATEGNSGNEVFASYGKDGDGNKNEFTRYAASSNVVGSNFKNYAEYANGGNDSFSSYGFDTNVSNNTFWNYAAGANGAREKFDNYRANSNGGNDEFQSYGKKSNGGAFAFHNYAEKDPGGGSKFAAYTGDANGQAVDFKLYGGVRTFEEYAKEGITFSQYLNQSSMAAASSVSGKGKTVKTWAVEPGKFFREETLRNGTIIPFPDIRDKMPKRSFLPRAISSKLPFSTAKFAQLQSIFHAGNDSRMARMLKTSLSECERAANRDETKQCVASIEDMIDFAVSVLGPNITVRTTESTRGYNRNIMIGKVEEIDGGKVTKSVSCHESPFPYLVYYCHSVPKVRVYRAEILDPKSTARINHGVAICHLDTTSWSAGHEAFVALGPGPGKIEVCHWIFENDMTWTEAN